MPLIDSHCHLRVFHQRGTLKEVLDRAAANGVSEFITVGTSTEDWSLYRELAQADPRIHYTVGLHPCHVADEADWETAVSQLPSYFTPGHPPVALGEIGLDHFHLPKDPIAAAKEILQQEEAFARQLEFARELDCPVIVHSRDSFADCVRLIDASGVNWERIVFHCFSGDVSQIQQLRQRGGRASFTGIITFRSAPAVRAALHAQGPEALMLETDCPYLAPVPHRGKENEPGYTRYIAEAAASVLEQPLPALLTQIEANTRAFFSLPETV